MQFFLPVVIGLVIQIMFVGITMIWPGLAIGMTTMIISLQNENIFKDRLTGLMNRFYLDKIEGELKQHQAFGLMMLDMNDFKSINDQYGHSEGDQALIAMGSILRKTVWVHGTVIRYAGDEFVIILYADREEFMESFKNLINQNIEEYNNRSGKGYRLSVSAGYVIFNLEKDTMDDIMKLVDQRMYEDKRRYYEENPQRERRHAVKNEEST
jgi:diguanylate cyclase (GGDEF)-like protein